MSIVANPVELVVDGRVAPAWRGTEDAAADELAGRLAEHLVATALVRKSVDDPVPFQVWWQVADALRAAVLAPHDQAVEEVDAAIAALVQNVDGLAVAPPVVVPVAADEAARSLRTAQVLVARLMFATTATSPTLLHVRLVRLRRALLAAG
jgi:hypothetical protein